MHHKSELATIAVLIVIAFFLRFYNLAHVMPFTYDQGRDMYELLRMSRGDMTLIGPTTGISGVFLGPFYFYFLLPGFLLSGGSPFGVAYWVLFWTTIALPLFYLILKPVVGQKWAMFGLGLLTITFGSIDEARVIWNPSLAAPVLLLSWWLLFMSLKKKWLLVLSLFLYGLSLHTELAYAVFLAPAYLWWILYHRKHYNWIIVLLSFVIAGTTLLPQVLFELRNSFLMTNSFLGEKAPDYYVKLTDVWKSRPTEMAAVIQKRTVGFDGYNLIGFIGIILSVLWVATNKPKPIERFMILVFTLPLLGLMLHNGNYGYFFPYYLNPHYLPALALIIMALSRIKLPLSTALVSGLAVVMILAMIKTGKVIYSKTVLEYTIQHQIAALMSVRERQQTSDAGLIAYVPNLVPINYQYLNEWLAFSGRTTGVSTVGANSNEYFLLYEGPPIAQAVTFDPWYKNNTSGAVCSDKEKFGHIIVERCEKQL
jgi:hypothetical protein